MKWRIQRCEGWPGKSDCALVVVVEEEGCWLKPVTHFDLASGSSSLLQYREPLQHQQGQELRDLRLEAGLVSLLTQSHAFIGRIG